MKTVVEEVKKSGDGIVDVKNAKALGRIEIMESPTRREKAVKTGMKIVERAASEKQTEAGVLDGDLVSPAQGFMDTTDSEGGQEMEIDADDSEMELSATKVVENGRRQVARSSNVPRCAAEELRDQSIAENRQLMLDLGLIVEKPKKAATKRKAPAAPAQPTRRSGRERKAVKYTDDDEDWEEENCGNKRKRGKVSKVEQEQKTKRLRRSNRDVPVIDYAAADPNLDSGVYCMGCRDYTPPPCKTHGEIDMQFVHPGSLGLKVAKSTIAFSGQGLFNFGSIIYEGTMIGPYTGTYIPVDEYKAREMVGKESGNAWVIYDSETLKIPVGYVDPGRTYDPNLNLLTKANHPDREFKQSLVAVQFEKQIYYRAALDILVGTEVFVSYGPEYAMDLGIRMENYNTFEGKENHSTVAVPCTLCDTNFSSQLLLELHLNPENGRLSYCRGKMLERMKDRKYKCNECEKAYKSPEELQEHVQTAHEKLKKFGCNICGKEYATNGGLATHIKTAHRGERVGCEHPDCVQTFTNATDMRRHYKNVHLEERDFQCPTCSLTFQEKSDLKQHVDSIHLRKRFLCPIADCGCTFGVKSNLTRHVNDVHKKERCFPCVHPGCDYTAARAQHLSDHVAGVHGTAMPFLCTFRGCDFATSTNIKLATHMKKAKKHEEDRKRAKIIDEACDGILNPFLCKVKT